MSTKPERHYQRNLGVDLGKRITPTTFVIADQLASDTTWSALTWEWEPIHPDPEFTLRHASRLPLHTDYTRVAKTLWKLATTHAIHDIRVDATGVGDAAFEIIANHRPLNCRAELRPVKLTAGLVSNGHTIGRQALLERAALFFENRRVRVVENLPGWKQLAAELIAIGPEGAKGKSTDDLAIAFALATWVFPEKKKAGEKRERLL